MIPFSRIDRNYYKVVYKGESRNIMLNFVSSNSSYDEINSFDSSIRRERYLFNFLLLIYFIVKITVNHIEIRLRCSNYNI